MGLSFSAPDLAADHSLRAHSRCVYIRLTGSDRSYGRQTSALSFIVNRPKEEPGFRLDRQESNDRVVRYNLHSYAVDRPAGARYED